jgi:2-amino-4-hydroxy-6-hydroxymethyldihydropteridine diphosphokinase
MNRAYLGLGSNVGDRAGYLRRALELLARKGEIASVSPLYETEPAGYRDQSRFLNAACLLRTGLRPDELLGSLKSIEIEVGRISTFVNGPREIDIDLLLYGQLILETVGLIIPHPRLAERAFALVPLSMIAPHEIHPVLGKTIRYLAEGVNKEGVKLSDLKLVRPGGAHHV